MLGKRCLVAVSRTITHGCYLRFLPFEWNSKTFKLSVSPFRRKLVIFLILLINLVIRTIFLVFSHFWNKTLLSRSASSKVLHFIWFVVCGIGCALSMNTFVNRHELSNFVTQYFHLQKQLKSKYLLKHIWPKKSPVEWTVESFLTIAYCNGFGLFVMFLGDPLDPRYYYSFYGTDTKLSVTLIILGIWEVLNCYLIWHSIIFSLILILCYWFETTFWLQEIQIHRKGMHFTDDTLRTRRNVISIYRSLQILNQYFNLCFRDYLLPFTQFMVVLLPVSCNYAIIKFHFGLSSTAASSLATYSACSIAFLNFGFPVGASLHTRSIAVLKSIRNLSKGRKSRKENTYLRPINSYFGNYMFLQKFTVFKMFGYIVYWTMKSLLLYR